MCLRAASEPVLTQGVTAEREVADDSRRRFHATITKTAFALRRMSCELGS